MFTPEMRHAAVRVRDDTLTVFYSNAHDRPERLVWVSIHLDPDWSRWGANSPTTLLSPEKEYEGADCPLQSSQRGAAHRRVRQLRDPCVFEEQGKTYLLYTVAGERGIAIGELGE